MTTEIYELTASTRELHGKANSRRMRHADQIPAVIYGAKKPATSITLSHNLVERALKNEAFFSHILTIDLQGKKEQVVVKDIQRHPFKPKVLHMDFLRVKANEKLVRNVPLHFVNEEKAPGVKAGGVVAHHASEVEVSCLPANLPEYIEVDLVKVELNENIHLSALTLSQGVELTALTGAEPNDLLVASIHLPHANKAPETETPAAETASSHDANAADGKE